MSSFEYINEFNNAQNNKIGPYYMFYIDMIRSREELDSMDSFLIWCDFRKTIPNFCILNGGIQFNDFYGGKEAYYMTVGDAVAVMIDIRETNIEGFRIKFKEFYSRTLYSFHASEGYVETLDKGKCMNKLYYGYAFELLDKVAKNQTSTKREGQMNKIMMSFQPQWLAKIANEEKKIEFRKTFPKDLPCEVFMCCTKGKPYLAYDEVDYDDSWGMSATECGFYLYKNNWELDNERDCSYPILNGLVVGKFTVEKVEEIIIIKDQDFGLPKFHYHTNSMPEYELLEKSCLDKSELNKYSGYKFTNLLSLHITNLEIFDKPKELRDYYRLDKNPLSYGNKVLTRAPRSWQYVKEGE